MELARILRPAIFNITINHRCGLHTSPVVSLKSWREKRNLPLNKNAYGPLTDLADYSFVDGRIAPVASGQRARMEEHKRYASLIVKLTEEVDFAVQRHKDIQTEKEEARQKYLDNKLKPKGHLLLKEK